jgi:hypothetical protein
LVEAALDHGEFVISGGGLAAYADVAAKEFGGFFEFLFGDADVR